MSEQPLAARMRPRSFEEFVGQEHLLGAGKALSRLVEGGHLPSILLWGPAGSGKTTLAHLLADAVGAQMTQLSAVSSGVADARKVMEGARGGPGLFRTVLFVDEVHRWSKAQQDVLLPAVEEGTITLIGATTENPYFSLNTPLLSRCLLLRLEPLDAGALRALLARALEDSERGLGKLGMHATDEALDHLVEISGGDARIALTGLDAAALATEVRGASEIDLATTGGRRPEEGDRVRPAGRCALRRDLRVHQEHPRLRPGRRAVLARPHARGGGGRPVHRAAHGHPRLGGHRPGRPAGAPDRHRRGAGGGIRRAARGEAEPRGGRHLPRPGAEIQQRHRLARPRDRGRAIQRRRAAAPARRPLSGGEGPRPRKGLPLSPRLSRDTGSSRSTGPLATRAAGTTSRRARARRRSGTNRPRISLPGAASSRRLLASRSGASTRRRPPAAAGYDAASRAPER